MSNRARETSELPPHFSYHLPSLRVVSLLRTSISCHLSSAGLIQQKTAVLSLKFHFCLVRASQGPFHEGHQVYGGGPNTQHLSLTTTMCFPLIVLLPLSCFLFCRTATTALFIPEINGDCKPNKSYGPYVYQRKRSMVFNERTGSWYSHCNLLVKQWIVLWRLTKALFFFFPSFAFSPPFIFPEESDGENYHQVTKWGTSASLFNYSACFQSWKKISKCTQKIKKKKQKKKKNHKKTLCRESRGKEQVWDICNHVCSAFWPVFRAHRASQWMKQLASASIHKRPCYCSDKPALRDLLEAIHLVFTWLDPYSGTSGAL